MSFVGVMLEPFQYSYMVNAMLCCVLVGAGCAGLSVYLMLRGWSLIGDTMSHAIVPGVSIAYILGVPFSLGAFVAGIFVAIAILILGQGTALKNDVVLGIVLTSFFAFGLFILSMYPVTVDIIDVIMGNVLTISRGDILQIIVIEATLLLVMIMKWREIMLLFFDENYARSVGLRADTLKCTFFVLLCATMVAALQTVGALMVLSMVVTPGATAYLLTKRFPAIIHVGVIIGMLTGFVGAYLSYFLNGATGGIIVVLQSVVFLLAFMLSYMR